jgi:hypothetical protein
VKQSRFVIAVLLIAALLALSFRTTSHSESAAPVIPCTTSTLGEAFQHPTLASIQNFGCESHWAHVWATVGRGFGQIGVTEVLHYDATAQHWLIVSRAADCKASILPSVIYHQGCFLN